MPRRRALRIRATVATAATAATCCVAGAWSSPVSAFEVEIDAETAAQGYQLRNAWGDPLLSRRRYLQTLGMHVSGIGDEGSDDSSGPDVSFHLRMRLDADFAIQATELSYEDYPSAFVPGLQRAPLDVMYGYFDVRNLAGGWLSARLGRQYVIDSLGWWSFDGALVRAELPVYVAVEAYGGLEQRAGLPLSTGRFERDGVWRGDRTSLDANAYPEFLEAGLAPAHGFVVESLGLPIVHGRVAYRRVWNTGKVATNPLPEGRVGLPSTTDGTRISQERLGASADALIEDAGALRAGLIHDLPRAQITSWYATLDGFVTSAVTAGVDVDRVVPTFDGDSIWSWFSTEPTTTLLGRVDAGLTDRLRAAVAGGARWVDIEAEGTGSPATMLDVIGRASARYELDDGRVGIAGLTDRGERGSRDGFDVFADQWFEDRFLVSGRVSLYDWRDELRRDRSATSFGYVLGGGYRIGEETTTRLEWEHDTNELVGQRYRILASLQLLVNR